LPITKLQSKVLLTLAKGRSPDSYVAGGIALNREGPRYSHDIFQDSEERLVSAAEEDGRTLLEAGFRVIWTKIQTGRRQARVEEGAGVMYLEWVADSDFRFYPAQPDDLFGYVLHPVDLATNKAAAAADRREPRDIVDLVTIHETILKLGSVVCASVGRFPGLSPEEMLAEIRRHSRFTAEEFRGLATEGPLDAAALHARIRAMMESAEKFLASLPSDSVGYIFLENGAAVEPDLAAPERYVRRGGSRRGIWPSSDNISGAMLTRYTDRD
jgi:hypothetical protein